MVTRRIFCLLCLLGLLMINSARAETMTLASTTSTENSGLLDFLLPRFTADTGHTVRVIAVGTGQAIRLARNGDADALLTHHRPSEEAFVATGFGTARHEVMYNDFVLVGPAGDPAGLASAPRAAEALRRIRRSASTFVSRGDESGTHKAEIALWQTIGSPPSPKDSWYRELGSGMGATLNAAVGMRAYTLVDRATWLSFGNRGDLVVLLEGDPALFNQYAITDVSPKRHPHVRTEAVRALIEWLTGPTGQTAIASFRISNQLVFFPNAAKQP